MVQISILSGIYTDEGPDFRTSYPVNMMPVPKSNGVSAGYLRPAPGIVSNGEAPGINRGGILWNDAVYRVTGDKLISIAPNGSFLVIGNVGTDGKPVTFDYSFDNLAIASAGKLWLYNAVDGLRQNVDPDLGTVVDVLWVDGYFMTTDGEFLVVSELNDPMAVNPLKYGSAEADPDPIVAIHKIRNEPAAINRYTIEYFDNTGGSLFPFQRIEGAQIQKGAVGTHAVCEYLDALAFVGGGFNEAVSVYLGGNATATKLGTREVEAILAGYTDAELASIKMETRVDKANQLLYIHCPDRTLVYDAAASAQLQGEPVWHVLTSTADGFGPYNARDFILYNGVWTCGHTSQPRLGHLDETVSQHWGEIVRWEFGTTIVYNESAGAIFHRLELVALPGRVALGEDPYISTSYSLDGETWSEERTIKAGGQGDRAKRIVWFQQGHMKQWRIQRFEGDSDAHLSFARLDAQLEPLAW